MKIPGSLKPKLTLDIGLVDVFVAVACNSSLEDLYLKLRCAGRRPLSVWDNSHEAVADHVDVPRASCDVVTSHCDWR